MNKDTDSYVKSEDLETLRVEINSISDKINDLRENVTNAIAAVGEEWRDYKYDEFAKSYEQYKSMMESIASEYLRYANEVLPPIIDNAKAIEAVQTSR